MSMPVRFKHAAGASETAIGRVAVLGAGSMGGGIAAQFANAGIPVDLLDIADPVSSSRSGPAEAGVQRQLSTGGFMHNEAAGLVRPGNVEDHISRLAEADWIVEAVIEDIEAKQALYRKVDAVRKRGSIVSSNTSTIPRARLVEGMPASFAADFVITHFFNPPRVMQLVELVAGADNASALAARTRLACETLLGKTVVDCRDTPGFIANRIGSFWIAVAVLEAQALGLDIEQVDAANAALGIPKTGVFGLLDLVGIDLVPHVWGSLMRSLPADDGILQADLPASPTIRSLIERGLLGRKSKAGFYRITADNTRESLDLMRGEYRAGRPCEADSLPGGGKDIATLINSDTALGRYAWRVISRVIDYAARHAGAIAGDIASIDKAIVLGYGWKRGPFALADAIGVDHLVAKLESEGWEVADLLRRVPRFFADGPGRTVDGGGRTVESPFPPTGLAAWKTGSRMFGNDAASLWDLGEGVAAFEVHTKMNNLAPAVFDVLERAIGDGGTRFGALVVGNDDARAFSVGADLAFFVSHLRAQEWAALDAYIERGQKAFLAMKYAPFPVVAAAHGFALGGGCEFMLHADAIVAHAELAAGLPEIKVGLVPAWGGCTQLLLRAQQPGHAGPKGPMAAATFAFERIFAGTPSTSALDARMRGLIDPSDDIVMARAAVLRQARTRALSMMRAGYRAPDRASLVVAGPAGREGIMNVVRGERAAGRLSDNDLRFAFALASVVTGGQDADPLRPMDEAALMALERNTLLDLMRTPATVQRIDHMLATGKPLRN